MCCEKVAVGGRWSNLSRPSSAGLHFFFSGDFLLLGYRKSDAEDVLNDEMIVKFSRPLNLPQQGEHTEAGQDPLVASGKRDGGELG